VQIDFYYFADCPSHEDALARLKSLLAQEGLTADIRVAEVMSEEEAEDLAFIGSPTIRVDGEDIDPGAAERHDYGLSCRVYQRADGRISPLPPPEMIAAALRRAAT
jgi:hypothetical protein